MRAIILAAGKSERWGNHLGIRKHELVVDGETLLARMIRQLRSRAVDDIVLVGPYDYGVTNFHPQRGEDGIDGRLASRPVWHPTGRTVILMGDVFYSENCMDAIAANTHEPRLFCRFTASEKTGKPYGEIWANSFMPAHQEAHAASLARVLALHRSGRIRRAGLWESYMLDHGKLLPRPQLANHGHATVIDDWTEDFDYPHDWDRWVTRR